MTSLRQWSSFPFLLILLVAGACAEAPPSPAPLTEGVWWSASAAPYDESVIELTATENGLEGEIHFLVDGDKVSALLLRPRDMAKIGALVLAAGRWQDRQVISAEWIRDATRAQIENASGDDGYGYLWWVMDPPRTAPEVGPVVAACPVRQPRGCAIIRTVAEKEQARVRSAQAEDQRHPVNRLPGV